MAFPGIIIEPQSNSFYDDVFGTPLFYRYSANAWWLYAIALDFDEASSMYRRAPKTRVSVVSNTVTDFSAPKLGFEVGKIQNEPVLRVKITTEWFIWRRYAVQDRHVASLLAQDYRVPDNYN